MRPGNVIGVNKLCGISNVYNKSAGEVGERAVAEYGQNCTKDIITVSVGTMTGLATSFG